MAAKFKAAVITDIHYGIHDRGKLGHKAERLMKKFTRAANDYNPDAVIDIGDRISARNHDQDKRYLKSLSKHFNKIAAPLYNVAGNHDIVYLSKKENEKYTGSPMESYSRDVNGYHLVFYNPVMPTEKRKVLATRPEDLEWLKKDLANTDKPTIVFSHVPLDDVSEKWVEDNKPDFANRFGYPNMGPKIRKIMEDSGKVVLSMSGHVHVNRYREINGIHYITQQSLTHKWRDHYNIPSGTWSKLEADADSIIVKLQGKTKKTYTLTPRPLSR